MATPHSHYTSLTPPSAQRGLSLVELMVALGISMLLLAAVAKIVATTNEGYRELHRSNEQAENGRAALQMLTEDLRLAGFYGIEFPTKPLPMPTAMPNPCATVLADVTNGLALPVTGYNDVTTSSTLPSCIPTAELVDNTDIITIRRAATYNTDANNNNVIDSGEMDAGQIYLQGDNVNYRVNTGSDPSVFDLTKKDAVTKMETRPLEVHTYYVASCNVCSGTNADTIPTLKRQDLTYSAGNPVVTEVPLVEGIEQLQITYGVDLDTYTDVNPNTDYGSADFYAGANELDGVGSGATTLANWKNVVSVRVDIVARNREPTAGYQDSKSYTLAGITWTPATNVKAYKRRAYTMTMRLENVGGRRER